MKVLGKLLVGGRLQVLLATVLIFSTSGALASGGSRVTLEWDPNPDTNVVGYVLYNGVTGAGELQATDVGGQTSATLTNLLSGVTNFFFVTAYDASGIEGEPSNLIATNLPGEYPPPTVSGIADQFIGTNSSAGPVSFTLTDTLFGAEGVTVSAQSFNPALVPSDNILFGGSGNNRSVTIIPTRDAVGSAFITITADDGIASGNTSFLVTVDPGIPSPWFYLSWEAESGTLIAPMAASVDSAASQGQSVGVTNLGLGLVTFAVDIPVSGAYLAWWRVLALTDTAYPFIVAVDGAATDIFQDTGAIGADGWHWSRVSGSARFAISNLDVSASGHTVLPLTAGPHEFSVWGLDPNMRLDEMLLTNDRNFIPKPPVLTVPDAQVLDELTPLVVTNLAVLSDPAAQHLTFALSAAPTGVLLDPVTGVLTWTPSEAQGPSTNFIGVQVTDDASPPNREIRSFKVVVNEVNLPPVLTVPPAVTVDELTSLVVVNTFSDPDLPVITPTFSLASAPDGMEINPNTGVLAWTPTEAQGPGTNLITVQVTDNGWPPFSDTKSFTIVVNEVNLAPVLPMQVDRTIDELTTLTVTNTASDADLPANGLTYQLVSPPWGASINTDGVITWTPDEAQGPGAYEMTTVVTDDGTPPLSATNSFTVKVNEVNRAPVLAVVGDQLAFAGYELTFTNTATDLDVPPNILTFSLDADAPAGATIDPGSGLFDWTPPRDPVPVTNIVTVRVADNGVPIRSDSQRIKIIVVSPPIIEAIVASGDTIAITWSAIPGKNYRVQFKSDLGEPTWTDLLANITPAGSTATISDLRQAAASRYYRVIIVP